MAMINLKGWEGGVIKRFDGLGRHISEMRGKVDLDYKDFSTKEYSRQTSEGTIAEISLIEALIEYGAVDPSYREMYVQKGRLPHHDIVMLDGQRVSVKWSSDGQKFTISSGQVKRFESVGRETLLVVLHSTDGRFYIDIVSTVGRAIDLRASGRIKEKPAARGRPAFQSYFEYPIKYFKEETIEQW